MNPKHSKVICYGLYRTNNYQTEWYETASRDAGKRARDLRKLGFKVTCDSTFPPQVTSVGKVKMTILTIHYPGDSHIPEPYQLEKI